MTDVTKIIPSSIKTSPTAFSDSKKDPDDSTNNKPMSTLTITPDDRPRSTTSLLGCNNLFSKFDEMVPQSSSCTKDDEDSHHDDHHHLRNNSTLQQLFLSNAPPLTPVQANTGPSPLEIMSPQPSPTSQFFPTSPGVFSHVIQSSPQRKTKGGNTENGDDGDETHTSGGGVGLELSLEHATPGSTASILGSILTPNTKNTPLNINSDNNDGSGLKTGHDYNWAAPIMVPSTMSSSSLSFHGSTPREHKNSSHHASKQRTMPQLTSPIRTSPLNLPRRDRSLLLADSPTTLHRSNNSRSRSPILRVTRKPFNRMDGDNVTDTDKHHEDQGRFANDRNNSHIRDRDSDASYHHQHQQHHHHHRHLGLQFSGDTPSHHATEPITVSFSTDTG